MHYQKRQTKKNDDGGVSPVIGVMLMLVVTIIIAATVSAFAGTSATGTQKAPTANVEIHVKNGGGASNSYFTMKVLGDVSEPITTKNLKVVTSWATTDRTSSNPINGGNTTYAALASASSRDDTANSPFSVPTGYGAGVDGWASNSSPCDQGPVGATSSGLPGQPVRIHLQTDYNSYSYTGSGIDPMQAILGARWYNLKQGDMVTVRVIHIPSGKELVDQQVVVEA